MNKMATVKITEQLVTALETVKKAYGPTYAGRVYRTEHVELFIAALAAQHKIAELPVLVRDAQWLARIKEMDPARGCPLDGRYEPSERTAVIGPKAVGIRTLFHLFYHHKQALAEPAALADCSAADAFASELWSGLRLHRLNAKRAQCAELGLPSTGSLETLTRRLEREQTKASTDGLKSARELSGSSNASSSSRSPSPRRRAHCHHCCCCCAHRGKKGHCAF